MIPPEDYARTDELLAGVELFHRMGANSFEVGHVDDTPLAEDARWYATATWRGTKVTEEEHRHPTEAVDALARRLLEGGQCVRCGAVVTTKYEGAPPGACRWFRDGPHWTRGCDGGWQPIQQLSRAQRRRMERVQRLRR